VKCECGCDSHRTYVQVPSGAQSFVAVNTGGSSSLIPAGSSVQVSFVLTPVGSLVVPVGLNVVTPPPAPHPGSGSGSAGTHPGFDYEGALALAKMREFWMGARALLSTL
jgi:hypothetical protein